jgi:23S rRNA pseudouridine1911/1915/1917 synthase
VRTAAGAIGRQALHAWRLVFPHPGTGRTLAIEAPLPADFRAALEALRPLTSAAAPPTAGASPRGRGAPRSGSRRR